MLTPGGGVLSWWTLRSRVLTLPVLGWLGFLTLTQSRVKKAPQVRGCLWPVGKLLRHFLVW